MRGFELFVNGRRVIAEGETQGSIELRSGTYVSLKAIYRVSNNIVDNSSNSFILHWYSNGSSNASQAHAVIGETDTDMIFAVDLDDKSGYIVDDYVVLSGIAAID